MKLITKEYLAQLRERDELDAILPDLLSQMGLNVFSRPARGTRQDGVDVAAVGRIDGGAETVYLFSIKAGDIGRGAWNSSSPQSLRPSLDAIQDVYIPHKLPIEHRGKPIAICICCGGDILETVRSDLRGYASGRETAILSFQEWNGDRLADLILEHFLREDLLPQNLRSDLRKSLALLEEPDASCQYFKSIVETLSRSDGSASDRLLSLRQLNLCLGILFAWSRGLANFEAAYRCSELVLLNSWSLCKSSVCEATPEAVLLHSAFQHSVASYRLVSTEFLAKSVLPHVGVRHGLSVAVATPSPLDVSLKLFDLLGRLALAGLWAWWSTEGSESSAQEAFQAEAELCAKAIAHLIENNPTLFLPRKDSQQIDVSMALLLLSKYPQFRECIEAWLTEMITRAHFSLETKFYFPAAIEDYADLLDIATGASREQFENATRGSILFPMLALWSALLDLPGIYHEVSRVAGTHLKHCNLQFWFPDSSSEESFYTNALPHGSTLSEIDLGQDQSTFLSLVISECASSAHYETLSAVGMGLWPIVAVACRAYRLPLPPQLLASLFPPQRKPPPSVDTR